MGRDKRSTKHLFNHWTAVSNRFRRARRIALMLDFDGTLAPICRHPRQVRLSEFTRAALRRLAANPCVKVAIISGRRRPDVRRHVGVRGVTYLGLHGWERGKNQRATMKLHRFMQGLRREVESGLKILKGIWIEDKYVGFTVHCRQAATRDARIAHSKLRQILASHLAQVRILDGKKVWEILPREVKGKGEAVRNLVKEIGSAALPVYAGDDLGDESAFKALPRGITVRVGTPRRTHARYQLRDPEETREFLERLEGEIS